MHQKKGTEQRCVYPAERPAGLWLEWTAFAVGAMPLGLYHAYDLLWLRGYTPAGYTKLSAMLVTVVALTVHAVAGASVFAGIARALRKGHRLRPCSKILRGTLAILPGLLFARCFTISLAPGFDDLGVYLVYIFLGPLIPSLLFALGTCGQPLPTDPACPQCGYVLYWARDRRCPECGRKFDLDKIDTTNAEVSASGILVPRSRESGNA